MLRLMIQIYPEILKGKAEQIALGDYSPSLYSGLKAHLFGTGSADGLFRKPSLLVYQTCRISCAEAIIYVDHCNAGCAGVKHCQQGCKPAEVCAVSNAGWDSDDRP